LQLMINRDEFYSKRSIDLIYMKNSDHSELFITNHSEKLNKLSGFLPNPIEIKNLHTQLKF